MKFGVREICEVVLKAKAAMKVGNKVFYANEPVIYFDTLKTSSMEGAATTVYAQGGRGNARLVAWEGERTITFTMEDALISPEGFMILSGAGLIDASEDKPIYQHVTETVDAASISPAANSITIPLTKKPYLPKDQNGNFAYVMFVKNGEIITEPFIPTHVHEKNSDTDIEATIDAEGNTVYNIVVEGHENYVTTEKDNYTIALPAASEYDSVLVDYYVKQEGGARQIEITPDKFGGNFYLEASTLFRNQDGVDMPAEFIIPNCKIQSNFTFTMASSGDPSSFTFTMDAFPDYTRFDHSKKVLAAIQIIENTEIATINRTQTKHDEAHNVFFN